MQSAPGTSLEVVEAQLFLHLLVRLFAGPSRFERGHENLQRSVGRVVGQMVFGLASRASLAEEPHLVARAVAMIGDGLAVGDANAKGRELGAERTLGPVSPCDRRKSVGAERRDDIARPPRLRRRGMTRTGSTFGLCLDWAQTRGHRVHELVARNADRPAQSKICQSTAKLGAHPIASVGEDVSERCTGRHHPLDFIEGDLPLRAKHDLFGYSALSTSRGIFCPGLGEVEPQRHRDRHVVARQRQRHERLAVGTFPELSTVLMGYADRVCALLHQGRVVNDQMRLATADQRLRLLEQYALVARSFPWRRRHEVMKLLMVAGALTSRHGLHAFALPRSDQSTQVDRRPAPLTLVPELGQKWLHPLLKLRLPLRLALVHRPPLEARRDWNGKVCGEVVLEGAGIIPWFLNERDPKYVERNEVLKKHRELAQSLGLHQIAVGALRKRLASVTLRLQRGVVHGDLNCRNVLIRGTVPLLIDFSHVEEGTILADPAWLEVNLVFGSEWGANSAVTPPRTTAWTDVVRELYDPERIGRPLPLHYEDDFGDEAHRLCGAVRSIRRYAHAVAVSDNEYAFLVGAALVRFASLHGDGKNLALCTERAAYAYAAASDIATRLGLRAS